MYIAMNRFKIALGSEAVFEDLWRKRESHLDGVSGFREFHLLRGSTNEDHTLYASHSVWDSAEAFEAWTESDRKSTRLNSSHSQQSRMPSSA